MAAARHTCLKLQTPQNPEPIFIKGTWFPSHFNLSITDGVSAWICDASEEEVSERASNWDQPISDYIDMSERYLGFQQPGSIYGFADAGGGYKRLSWTFEKEGTKLEWRWKCKPAENNKKITAGILDFLMDANIRLSEEVVMKTRSNEKLNAEAEKCLMQSEKFHNEKAEFETTIYSKFLGVLNAKKAKLRELRDRPSNQETSGKAQEDEEESTDKTETFDGNSEDEDEEEDSTTNVITSTLRDTSGNKPRGRKRRIQETGIKHIFTSGSPYTPIKRQAAMALTHQASTMLEDKVVMVTGASSGLGWEFCMDLAKAGCRIVAAARRTDRLKSLCDEINGFRSSGDDVRAKAVELDVTADGATIEAHVNKAWDAFGRIDALINNAGIRGPVHDLLDLSEEDWNKTIQTNLTGSWLVSKYVCLRMRGANQGGLVINISSIDGLDRGHTPRGLAYCSSKSALNTITKVMAMELGVHKIRVNAICPGIFKSEITDSLLKTNWLERVVQKTVPLKEFGSTNPSLTSLVRYLIQDSSEYVTGNIYIVDSGTILPSVPIFSSL